MRVRRRYPPGEGGAFLIDDRLVDEPHRRVGLWRRDEIHPGPSLAVRARPEAAGDYAARPAHSPGRAIQGLLFIRLGLLAQVADRSFPPRLLRIWLVPPDVLARDEGQSHRLLERHCGGAGVRGEFVG